MTLCATYCVTFCVTFFATIQTTCESCILPHYFHRCLSSNYFDLAGESCANHRYFFIKRTVTITRFTVNIHSTFRMRKCNGMSILGQFTEKRALRMRTCSACTVVLVKQLVFVFILIDSEMAQGCDSNLLRVKYRIRCKPGTSIQSSIQPPFETSERVETAIEG